MARRLNSTDSTKQTVFKSTHTLSLLLHYDRRRCVRVLEYAVCLIDPNLLMLVECLFDALLKSFLILWRKDGDIALAAHSILDAFVGCDDRICYHVSLLWLEVFFV